MKPHLSINAIQKRMAQGVPDGTVDEPTVRRLWWGALDTLQYDIFGPMDVKSGIWLASPLPALYEPRLLNQLQGWVWAPEELDALHFQNAALLPPSSVYPPRQFPNEDARSFTRLPLYEIDGKDPFLMIITSKLQIALALQGPPGHRKLVMRSDIETFRDLLEIINSRLNYEQTSNAKKLRNALEDLCPFNNNNSIEKVFWPLLSARLASMTPSLTLQPISEESFSSESSENEFSGQLTLLEALTHEIRTPLATIRTLIRSLLKRKDLPELAIDRLKEIDSECTEQIDRFGLIFNAAELQRRHTEISELASTDLGRMLKILCPGWMKQLDRRGIKLDLDITPDLPFVLSDPAKLELMLGGLVDRSTRGLAPGSIISLELRPAGHRLKLQITTKSSNQKNLEITNGENISDLGSVLSWNPSTGSLQLSQAATQRMLASLGGRLTRRRDTGLTVFFPISEAKI